MHKLIEASVFAAIGVLVFASLLIPVVDDATATTDTFKNNGYFTYDPVTDDTNVILTWAKASPDVITIGDKDVSMPSGAGSWTIVGSENFTLRYYNNGTIKGVQMYSTVGYISINTSSTADSATITVTGTTLTVTDGTNTRTPTMGTHGFVLNSLGTGSLALKYSNEPAYVNGDTEVYLCGTTFVTGSGTNDFVGVFGYGSLDDGLTMSAFYGNTGQNTVSFGDVTAVYTAVNGYLDLYKLDKFEFDLSQNSATVAATYSYFVVPTQVTAEKAIHADEPTREVMAVLPLILICALIMGVVGYAVYQRME